MNRVMMPLQKGECIDWTNATGVDISVGDVVPLNTFCGVAATDIPADGKGVLVVGEAWRGPAVAEETVSVGDPLYWDADAKKITKTSTSNTFLGVAIEPKVATGTVVGVKIGMPLSFVEQVSVAHTHSVDIATHAHDETTGDPEPATITATTGEMILPE